MYIITGILTEPLDPNKKTELKLYFCSSWHWTCYETDRGIIRFVLLRTAEAYIATAAQYGYQYGLDVCDIKVEEEYIAQLNDLI